MGGLRSGRLVVRLRRGVGEPGVPAVEVAGEVVVEHSGADLKEQVGPAWGPAHLLLLDHAFGDDLVHDGFGDGGGDDLPGPVALAVVGDGPGVGGDVAPEIADGLVKLGVLGGGGWRQPRGVRCTCRTNASQVDVRTSRRLDVLALECALAVLLFAGDGELVASGVSLRQGAGEPAVHAVEVRVVKFPGMAAAQWLRVGAAHPGELAGAQVSPGRTGA